MTTIAYRSGIISADSQISYSTFHNGTREKIAVKGAYLVALAGQTWLRNMLEKWAEEGCPEDNVPDVLIDNDDKFEAIFIDKDGNCFHHESGFLVPVIADYCAIGSGAMFAMGAMAHGATAEEAVAAAALHDKSTGGNIQSLHHSILRS